MSNFVMHFQDFRPTQKQQKNSTILIIYKLHIISICILKILLCMKTKVYLSISRIFQVFFQLIPFEL